MNLVKTEYTRIFSCNFDNDDCGAEILLPTITQNGNSTKVWEFGLTVSYKLNSGYLITDFTSLCKIIFKIILSKLYFIKN